MNCYKTSQEVIQSLEVISDSIVLSSSNQSIVKSDIANKRQLLKISTGSVSIKYDSVNSLIVGEFYNNIHFWNQQGENIMSKQNAHDLRINQIQLIQNSQQLLSLDEEGILKMWFINLNQKDLILLNNFQDLKNRIMSIYSIQNDMRIVLYQEYGVTIVNQKMQNKKELNKFTRNFNYSNNLNIKQSKLANFIPILSEGIVHMLEVSQ